LTFPATADETDSTDPAPAQTAATPTTNLTHLSILIPIPLLTPKAQPGATIGLL
jgi:hypothetical protein